MANAMSLFAEYVNVVSVNPPLHLIPPGSAIGYATPRPQSNAPNNDQQFRHAHGNFLTHYPLLATPDVHILLD